MPRRAIDHGPPPDAPLYNAALEHDACGIGFIADRRGRSRRDLVGHGLSALRRLAHRGPAAALDTVDGCGVMTAIPWGLLIAGAGDARRGRRTADRDDGRSRRAAAHALGMFFIHAADADAARLVIEASLREAGAPMVWWRRVPVEPSAVPRAQRATTPEVWQAMAAVDASDQPAERRLYRARLRIERAALELTLRLTVVSLSTKTVVYKALVTPSALPQFYPDLADAAFESPFILFHQRFSTNTSADWTLAQPFRALAHNGEINTIAGNRWWMQARLADRTSLPSFGAERPIRSTGSDSQTLDEAVELMRHHGYSLAHAVSRLIPPAWEADREMPSDVRAFYEYESLVSEPWDGPAALVFSDGERVGAAVDRNGFRPARIVTTADGLVAVSSEVGVLPSDEHEILDRGRLGPGEMIVVDLTRGAVHRTREIRCALARHQPYRRLLHEMSATFHGGGDESVEVLRSPALARLQAAAGCSREEIDLVLAPMAASGQEAVGSMGDDTPPAVLSSVMGARPFSDFFRQRFAQVTNPPVDPHRESSVMSLRTLIGAQGSFLDEAAPRPRRLALKSPIVSPAELRHLQRSGELVSATIDMTFAVSGGIQAFDDALAHSAAAASGAVNDGASILVLTDRALDAERAAVPSLLVVSVVHHALIERGLRLRASLVVDCADARDPHQVAALCAYGASAVCPRLGYQTIAALTGADRSDAAGAVARYRLALEQGLLKIASKMGVCTFSSYCGAQLFEILGLDPAVVDRCFPGTLSPLGGLTLADVATTIIDRHRRAFTLAQPALEYPGLHSYRRGGEYHATNPLVVRQLHAVTMAAVEGDEREDAYRTFTRHVYARPAAAIRDLLEFAPRHPERGTSAGFEREIDAVESVDAICRRFFASAMSVGALSPDAHRTIATAMNRLGARSNSGEGGEEPDRFARPAAPLGGEGGEWDGSRTKQVASARFGVTAAYLRSADELQIKIAQGSKPGEGGQLPAIKVVAHIARLRHAQPGTPLISPPVHHDIYSIEDLAQLIHDLRAVQPAARINVKLVASTGVGIIAAGVAKTGADAIQISGHDGGTGASPRASIKHVGLPWEIGLTEAHQVLARAGLRDRVVLQVDGGLKTGRDIAVAAALGADEYGFGTAALVALGCVMARQCHADTCPVGIATQRDDLRAKFSGTADMLIAYLRLVAGEVRTILASLGLTRVDQLIGRADLLRPRAGMAAPLVLAPLLVRVSGGASASAISRSGRARSTSRRFSSIDRPDDSRIQTMSPEHPLTVAGVIRNTDRSFGAALAGAVAARAGDRGLPDGSIDIAVRGSAGQSFGAFGVPGMRLALVGDANDGLGKGLHGGEIIVSLPPRERGRTGQVLVGNAALYGATGGRVFIAGAAGERFAVRNSGATAVVEGVGDHACEYMTGGVVVVLGSIGRNFAAGMSGGIVYVYDVRHELGRRCNAGAVAIEPLTAADELRVRELLERHQRATGSRRARALLLNRTLAGFRKVVPPRAADARGSERPDEAAAVAANQ